MVRPRYCRENLGGVEFFVNDPPGEVGEFEVVAAGVVAEPLERAPGRPWPARDSRTDVDLVACRYVIGPVLIMPEASGLELASREKVIALGEA